MPRLYSLIVKPSESTPFVPPPEGEIWHLRQAALTASSKPGDYASLTFKTSESQSFSLGTLRHDRVDFMSLDMPLTEYVEFSVKGNIAVHLTGSLVSETDDLDLDDEDVDMQMLQAAMQNGANRGLIDEEDSSEESEEEPGNLVQIEEIPVKETSLASSKEVEEKVESAKEKVALSKSAAKKLKRKQKKEAEKAKKAGLEESDQTPKKQKLNEETKPSTEIKSPETKSSSPLVKLPETKTLASKKKKTRRFSNGYVIEILHSGPEVSEVTGAGKKVTIKYVGKLQDGTVFDETHGDKVFTFRYGAGEVIKGLDKGLDDMRVGDKRRLTVPPKMGYGSQGAEPAVPPNAQLTFDVELVGIAE